MDQISPDMSPAELREALDALRLSQDQFGQSLGYGKKTAQRWVADGGSVPGAVAILARLMMARPELMGLVQFKSRSNRGRPAKRV